MRLTFICILAAGVVGCGSNTTNGDMSGADMQSNASMDMAAGGGDAKMVTIYNMPGKIYCYSGTPCSTTSTTPVCCDSKTGPDASFIDSCTATAMACLAMDPKAKTFACGQAADCTGMGMICCGTTGTSKSGTAFLASTQCAASACASGDTQLCVSDAECKTAGTHCVGQSITGRDIGLCK